jgi:hypothetical protein
MQHPHHLLDRACRIWISVPERRQKSFDLIFVLIPDALADHLTGFLERFSGDQGGDHSCCNGSHLA